MSKKSKKKWSQKVTDNSDAMDLKDGVFNQRSAKQIADSLKHSAEQSDRRKSSPFQSAMSMLTFYINRAGEQVSKSQRATLDKAIDWVFATEIPILGSAAWAANQRRGDRRPRRKASESHHTSGSNNGVSRAKPRVVTHSHDATMNKCMPGTGNAGKDWD